MGIGFIRFYLLLSA